MAVAYVFAFPPRCPSDPVAAAPRHCQIGGEDRRDT